MSSGFNTRSVIFLHLAGIAAFSASPGPKAHTAERHNQVDCAASGDIAFRKSDFESAESSYRRALAEDNTCARAVWGLGRIEELNFRRVSARGYFADAFRLDPEDPKIIRSYASVVADQAAESNLLRNYIAAGGDGLAGAEFALGHIQLHDRL